MITLLLFLLILGLIVFIHEFGHFIFAKKAGIHVYEFSLGFGPKLFSFHRKNDETEYMIKLIPLGGYVALAGEEYEDEDNKSDDDKKEKIPEDKKLYNKSFLRQFSVMVAGVFNNFLLGFVLLLIIGFASKQVAFPTNVLDGMEESFPLYQAGARDGQKIVEINNKEVSNIDDIRLRLAIAGDGKTVNITVEDENNNRNTYKIKPQVLKDDQGKESYFYGISTKVKSGKGILSTIKFALYKFGFMFKSLVITIICLFTGKLGLGSLSGPVGIYSVVGETAKYGVLNLLSLTAYLSINVGFMNILPFPAFDGGRAFLLIIEKITKKKVPLKVETLINNIGFFLLMALMVYVTIKDILKLI